MISPRVFLFALCLLLLCSLGMADEPAAGGDSGDAAAPAESDALTEVCEGESCTSDARKVAIANVLRWASLNGATISDSVRFLPSPLDGYGLFAQEAIRADTLLLSVPAHLFFSLAAARDSPLWMVLESDVFDHEALDERAVLSTMHALFLMHEVNADADSDWKPYLSTLPDYVDTPLYWDDTLLAAFQSSRLHRTVYMRNEAILDAYNIVFPRLFERWPLLFDASTYSVDTFRWAMTMLSSRAQDVALSSSSITSLLPIVDLINGDMSDDRVNVYFDQDPETQAYELYAAVDIAAGQEIVQPYEPRSSADFLVAYGFSPRNNTEESVSLPLPSAWQKKANDTLVEFGVWAPALTLVDMPSPDVMSVARLVVMADKDVQLLRLKRGNTRQRLSALNERRALQLLSKAVRRHLHSYGTSLGADERALAAADLEIAEQLAAIEAAAAVMRETEAAIAAAEADAKEKQDAAVGVEAMVERRYEAAARGRAAVARQNALSAQRKALVLRVSEKRLLRTLLDNIALGISSIAKDEL
eukprot:PLAT13341.1.p1 GENE.PLAT13341.1~~PLAT13341.1.p1  ORF type:complete len:531 (+),score=287.21 PLAT13341.1:22-1614(+)